MVLFEGEHQQTNGPQVSPIKNFSSSAGCEIPSASSKEDTVKVDRLENKLYSVVELLEDAIKSHFQLRTEILPQLHSKCDQLCDQLNRSLSQMNDVVNRNANSVRNCMPNQTCDSTRTFNTTLDHNGFRNGFSTSEECYTVYGNSIQAQIDQFINWQGIWQVDLMNKLERHLEETNEKLMTLIAEDARRHYAIALSLRDGLLSQQTCNSFTSGSHLDKLGSIYGYQPEIRASHRFVERADLIEKSPSDTHEVYPELDSSLDRILITPSTIQPNCEVVEPEIPRMPVVSCSVMPKHPCCGNVNASNSHKLPHILAVLGRKQEEQSLSIVSNPQEVRQLRAAANQDIEELWQSVETHRVDFVPHDSLCVPMKSLVVLSLMFDDKKLFYDHALYCAQQLRNPANVDELAVVTTSNASVAPLVDWSCNSSTCQYLPSLTTPEKRFFDQVAELNPRLLVIWCSAYACLLLRLADRGDSYVRLQLSQLNRQLADAYKLAEHSLPQVPLDSPAFVDRLRRYSNCVVDPVRKNTLYKGLIERYECTVLPQRTKKLLNFLLLTSLRYRGMSLVTLVDECRKLYEISSDELMQKTMADETRTSWQAYEKFVNTFVKSSHSRKYKYCEVFSPQKYADLHFSANYSLCALLCTLIDMRKVKNGCEPLVLYHRIVKRARANNNIQPRVDEVWRQKCRQIARKFFTS